MKNIYKYIKNNFFYCLIYLLFIIEVMINLQSKYLSRDESFSYNIIHHSFINIINLTSQDVHPFLYYFIGKIFIYNINNMYLQIRILRIVSALPYLILLIISSTYIQHKFSRSISIIFMFCIISMPLLSENIYTIRMYGWATLFTIVVYLLFRYSYKNNNVKVFALISLFSILASYTHYYALMTISILYILFFILFIIKKKKLKNIILSISINLIFYIPWLNVLLNQTNTASKSFWTEKLTLKHLIAVILGSISPVYQNVFFYILPLALLMILFITIFNKNININTMNIIGILVPFLLIIIGSVLSIILNHTVLMARYIMPAIGIFWLEFSIIIMNINVNYKITKFLLIFLTLAIGIISYINTNANTINLTNKFNQTLKIYNKISKNSAFIYNDSAIMLGRTDYLKNNYILNYNKNDIYAKTLNNFNRMNNIDLPLKYKNIYYVKSNYSTILTNKLNNKYKINNKDKIYLPITDDQSNFYKIK